MMKIAIGLFPEVTILDAVGPYQVLSGMPGAEIVLCAAERGTVADDRGLLRLDVAHTFDEVVDPDIIVIPGGLITRPMARDGHPIVEWIRAVHPGTTWTTSVCTGSLLLGAAGLLDGLEATTHWSAYDELARYGARPTGRRVVIEGKIITAAGVSAGIDMALTLAGRVAGDETAQAIQLGIEYDPQPPYDSGAPDKATSAVRELLTTALAR